jgi:hypothetical protein
LPREVLQRAVLQPRAARREQAVTQGQVVTPGLPVLLAIQVRALVQ